MILAYNVTKTAGYVLSSQKLRLTNLKELCSLYSWTHGRCMLVKFTEVDGSGARLRRYAPPHRHVAGACCVRPHSLTA